MKLSRGAALFLLAFGVWSYLLWPTFIRNIWASDRSWDLAGAPTSYLIVHLVIGGVSLVLGTIIGVLGWRGLRAARAARHAAAGGSTSSPSD
ncbi:SCO4848 family membrane protein [Bounagaea algeriensis]